MFAAAPSQAGSFSQLSRAMQFIYSILLLPPICQPLPAQAFHSSWLSPALVLYCMHWSVTWRLSMFQCEQLKSPARQQSEWSMRRPLPTQAVAGTRAVCSAGWSVRISAAIKIGSGNAVLLPSVKRACKYKGLARPRAGAPAQNPTKTGSVIRVQTPLTWQYCQLPSRHAMLPWTAPTRP